MIFRFDGTGYYTVHVFYGTGHAHHAVGLQLAAVNDGISLIQIGCVLKIVRHSSPIKMLFPYLKILIKHSSVLFRFYNSAALVDPVKVGGIIYSAGTVSDDNLCAPLGQQLAESAKQRRVGCYGVLRWACGNQICLNNDFHVGGYPIQSAQWL